MAAQLAAQMAAAPQTPTSLPASLPIRQQPTSGRSDRTRTTPTSSRSTNAMPPMGTDLPRENSHIINRIVVDDPQADLAREEARQAEGRPRQQQPDTAAMGRQQQSQSPHDAADPAPVQRSRHEHLRSSSTQRREAKFGDYILGQTIGSGEFGKVKMGWKKGSTVQVAIKLIRKDAVSNTNRQAKIQREIDILRNLKHPNIVRLHEYVETERHMGIILEYASGGELFDYILTHRYLKDPAAKRLFAQLISGVGYLHAHGIVHRDLKLENLLLDRNKHIIITDFGFANTFNPNDDLPDDVVRRITDKEFVKREGLDKIITAKDNKTTYRRGDLMQTSCGSPCYAAPELVVHDGLYTGRLVDVWSCGVILYAMLAGYLPFDDDPANPDGDNINLLYKYICSTPLTFPEFVTPHARDLLRRILVPEPRQRADLFEVARHSWLSEYSHVVGFIGSRVMSDQDLGQTAAATKNEEEPRLGRSASVREPSSKSPAVERGSAYVPKHGPSASVGGDEAMDSRYRQRDAKRNTVQIEPPAASSASFGGRSPDSTTKPAPLPMSASKTRARSQGQGPDEVPPNNPERTDKYYTMQPPAAPGSSGHTPRATSDSRAFNNSAPQSASRPNTSGTFGGTSRLPSRGNSYSQPAAAQTNTTTAQGSFSQPKSSSGYIITGPVPGEPHGEMTTRPQSEQNRIGGQFATPQQPASQLPNSKVSGHKRSSTLGTIADKMLNRSSSRRSSAQQQENAAEKSEKRDRRYPPVSMKNAMPPPTDDAAPRPSNDSRRPSFGFSRRPSRDRDSSVQTRRSSRRFSWLPSSLSMGSFGGKKDQGYESGDDGYRPGRESHQQPPMSQQPSMSRTGSNTMAFGQGAETPGESTDSTIPMHYEPERERAREQRKQQSRYDKALPPSPVVDPARGSQRSNYNSSPQAQRKQFRDDGYGSNTLDNAHQQEPIERFYTPSQEPQMAGSSSRPEQYNVGGTGDWEQYEPNPRQQGLRPQQKKLGYDSHGHGGSSNAARKVMNYFRNKRGRESEA